MPLSLFICRYLSLCFSLVRFHPWSVFVPRSVFVPCLVFVLCYAVILSNVSVPGSVCVPLPASIGSAVGTVAGAVSGVVAAGGASTLATCPTLAITTLAGSSMVGPAAPLVALLAGALLGGVAGGTAGGVYTCQLDHGRYVIKYKAPGHHSGGTSYHYKPAYSYSAYPAYPAYSAYDHPYYHIRSG